MRACRVAPIAGMSSTELRVATCRHAFRAAARLARDYEIDSSQHGTDLTVEAIAADARTGWGVEIGDRPRLLNLNYTVCFGRPALAFLARRPNAF